MPLSRWPAGHKRDRDYVDSVLSRYLKAGQVVTQDSIDELARGLKNYLAYVRVGKV
jgi:hypothetical protein